MVLRREGEMMCRVLINSLQFAGGQGCKLMHGNTFLKDVLHVSPHGEKPQVAF